MNSATEGFPRQADGTSFISLGGWQDEDIIYTWAGAKRINSSNAFDGTYPGTGALSTWQTAPNPLPAGKANVVAAHVYLPNSKKVLVAGGLDETTTLVSSAYLYDPAANSWTATVALPI